MADTSTHAPRTDAYISARKGDLAAALTAAAPEADRTALADVFKLTAALLHHEAYERLEQLKALYDRLDPDAPAARRDASREAYDAFETALNDALARGNFTEIEANDVRTAEATKHLTGLKIKPSRAGIREVRFFARGVRPETIETRSWLGLRKRVIETTMMADVIVLVGFKADDEIQRADRRALVRMRRGVRPGAVLVKHFRNVAAPELVTLHPGATPSMRPRDQVFLAAPAIAAGVPVLLNLWPALTVLAAIAAAYFTADAVIDNERLTRAVGALGGLVAVGAFVMRQRLKLEATTLRYQKRLADTVYFRNLANNAGVLDLLVGAGEEQDAKEALLAYSVLHASGAALSKADIDRAAEAFLRDRLNVQVDFEIGDALSKLERLGLVAREGDAYRAVDPADARNRLDAAWDNLFKFSGAVS